MADSQYLVGHGSRVGSEKDSEVETNIWSISFVWTFSETSILLKKCLESNSSVYLYGNTGYPVIMFISHSKMCITAPEKKKKPKQTKKTTFMKILSSLEDW